MLKTAVAALLIATAPAQQAPVQDLETLFREMQDYASQADEHYKQAAALFETYGSGQGACYHADRAVQFSIRARNRVIRARRQVTDRPALRAQLDELYTNSARVLNIYKTLFNDHCGNEPYEMTEEK